jgi:hypothetical protein
MHRENPKQAPMFFPKEVKMFREKHDGTKWGHFSKELRMVKQLLFFFACLFLIAIPPVGAATWDATADFPGSTNPNGVWSYGCGHSSGGNLLFLYEHFGYDYDLGGSPFWNDPTWGSKQPPIVWKNMGPPIYGVQTGELALHPGPWGQFSIVRWTSPGAGIAKIAGKFGAGDIGTVSYVILHNEAEIWSQYGTDKDGVFSLTRAVSTGDTIDFKVGLYYPFGSTPLYATIDLAPVPFPAILPLLLAD